jgi:hypothetical protein
MLPLIVVRCKSQQVVDAPLYNFAVEQDESYVVGGVVCHNCRCVPIPVDRWTWAEKRAAGARIAQGYPDVPA